MPESIPALFFECIDRDPGRTAVYVQEDGEWAPLTWAQIEQEVSRLAQELVALGVGKGVPVAILSETRPEWTAVDMAVLCLGGITIGVYPSLLPEQVAYQLRHAGAKVLFVENAEQWAKVEGIRDEVPELEHVLSFEPVEGLRGPEDLKADPDVAWLRDVAAPIGPDDVATIIYTSGTTGDPKGAVLNHGHFVRVARAAHGLIPTQPRESTVIFLPLAHSLQRFAMYAGFLEDGVGYYAPSIQALPETLTVARPSVLATVPRMLEKIQARATAAVEEKGGLARFLWDWSFSVGLECSRREERGQPISRRLALRRRLAHRLVFRRVHERMGGNLRLLVCGGSRLDPDVARWYHAMGVTVLEGWGLTETCAPATLNTPDAFRFGTVGRPLPGVDVRIADDGEILVRGVGVFAGYFRDEAATAEAFEEEWFKTGDVGEIDADGFLRITDRKKEILVTAGGKNIPPVNIEKRIERSPWVSQAVTIGDDRPYLVALLVADEDAVAALARRNGWPDEDLATRSARPEVRALLAEAVDQANRGLARFETIKKWAALPAELTVETGELTPTLKLKRRVVSAKYADVIEGLYAR